MAKNTLETAKPKAYGRRVKDIPQEYRIPEIDYDKHANDVIYVDAEGKPIEGNPRETHDVSNITWYTPKIKDLGQTQLDKSTKREIQKKNADERVSQYNAQNILGSVINPALNFISPSQQFGAIVDKLQGERGYWEGIAKGNSGFVTDKFNEEHPWYSLAINGIGDAVTFNLGKQLITNFNRAARLEKNYDLIKENLKNIKRDNGKPFINLENDANLGEITDDVIRNIADAQTFSINPFDWRNSIGNTLRYYKGKLGRFKDADLPNFYRKVKYNLDDVSPNILTDGKGNIAISSPDHRFLYNGKPTPWTNVTIDNPVMPHAESWDDGFTFIGNMKQLLNKRILSTTPGDVVINGDITLPAKSLKSISGNSKYIKALKDKGIKVIDDEKVKEAFNNTRGIKLDFTNYGNVTRQQLRKHIKSPTLKDLEFADYVFKPIINHNAHSVMDFDNFMKYALKGDNKALEYVPKWIKNTYIKHQKNAEQLYLSVDAPKNWKNIQYHPAPYGDDSIRKAFNMTMLPVSNFKYDKFVPIKNNYIEHTIMPSLEDINLIPYTPSIISKKD